MVSKVLFSSERDNWETPNDFFAGLDDEFGFTLDAAASLANAKCPNYYDKEDDALSLPWRGIVWCNPPYGKVRKQNYAWVAKARREARDGATVVMLLPARTDVKWFHEIAMFAHEIRFVSGRLTFKGGKAAAPFPSVILVFRPELLHSFPRINSLGQDGRWRPRG